MQLDEGLSGGMIPLWEKLTPEAEETLGDYIEAEVEAARVQLEECANLDEVLALLPSLNRTRPVENGNGGVWYSDAIILLNGIRVEFDYDRAGNVMFYYVPEYQKPTRVITPKEWLEKWARECDENNRSLN